MNRVSYQIIILDEESKSLSIALKDFLENRNASELEHIDFNEKIPNKGEMGVGDVLGSISLVIKAASNPLTELAKALRDFVQSYRTEIEIRNGDKVVKISSSRPQKIEELVKILTDNF